MDGEDESTCRLADHLRDKLKFRYEYDFGDNWTHAILVEKFIPAAGHPALMVCTAGKGQCPPEDCGGLWGDYEKLNIQADPKHPEHDDIREWLDDDINPNDFDAAIASKAIARLIRM